MIQKLYYHNNDIKDDYFFSQMFKINLNLYFNFKYF